MKKASVLTALVAGGLAVWVFFVKPLMPDVRFRSTVDILFQQEHEFAEFYPVLIKEQYPPSDTIVDTCAKARLTLDSLGVSVAKADALRHALRGPGKQELAEQFVTSATQYWRESSGAVDEMCDAMGTLLVEMKQGQNRPSKNEVGSRTLRIFIRFSDRSNKASRDFDEMTRLWQGLDVLLFRLPTAK